MSPTDPDPRRTIAMYLRAAGFVILVFGFIGSLVWVHTPSIQAIAILNAGGFALVAASKVLVRDWMGAALFIFLGFILVLLQASLP